MKNRRKNWRAEDEALSCDSKELLQQVCLLPRQIRANALVQVRAENKEMEQMI